ncbi:MAG: rhodanese-like domain-containing protein [Pyrinomonadaceae bacterium]
MKFKNWKALSCPFLLCLAVSSVEAGSMQSTAQVKVNQRKSQEVELIAADELKAKIDKNEPVTVLDVRSTDSYIDSDNQIKGAIHVKLRRLKYRLAFPPLKNVPRNQEVVTYCACPADESSIFAARVLMDAGFNRVRALKGGWQAWHKVRGAVEPRPKG